MWQRRESELCFEQEIAAVAFNEILSEILHVQSYDADIPTQINLTDVLKSAHSRHLLFLPGTRTVLSATGFKKIQPWLYY